MHIIFLVPVHTRPNVSLIGCSTQESTGSGTQLEEMMRERGAWWESRGAQGGKVLRHNVTGIEQNCVAQMRASHVYTPKHELKYTANNV